VQPTAAINSVENRGRQNSAAAFAILQESMGRCQTTQRVNAK